MRWGRRLMLYSLQLLEGLEAAMPPGATQRLEATTPLVYSAFSIPCVDGMAYLVLAICASAHSMRGLEVIP